MRIIVTVLGIVLISYVGAVKGQTDSWGQFQLELPKDASPTERLRGTQKAAYHWLAFDSSRGRALVELADRRYEAGLSREADFYQPLLAGLLALEDRQMEAAKATFDRAHRDARKDRDREYIGRALGHLGQWHLIAGNPDSARQKLSKSLRGVNDPFFQAQIRLDVLQARVELGEADQLTARNFSNVRDHAREADMVLEFEPWIQLVEAQWYLGLDSLEAASKWLDSTMVLFQRYGDVRGQQAVRSLEMELRVEEKQPEAGLELLETWLEVAGGASTPERARVMALKGDLQLANGNAKEALAAWEEAGKEVESLGMEMDWIEVQLKRAENTGEAAQRQTLLAEARQRALKRRYMPLLEAVFRVQGADTSAVSDDQAFEAELARRYADTLATRAQAPQTEAALWTIVEGDSLRPYLLAEQEAESGVSSDFYLWVTLAGLGIIVILPILIRRIRKARRQK